MSDVPSPPSPFGVPGQPLAPPVAGVPVAPPAYGTAPVGPNYADPPVLHGFGPPPDIQSGYAPASRQFPQPPQPSAKKRGKTVAIVLGTVALLGVLALAGIAVAIRSVRDGGSGASELKFLAQKTVVKKLTGIDVTPYKACFKATPFSSAMLDATVLRCVDNEAERRAYIDAALKIAFKNDSITQSETDCLVSASASEAARPFFVDLSQTDTALADEAAVEEFTRLGVDCASA